MADCAWTCACHMREEDEADPIVEQIRFAHENARGAVFLDIETCLLAGVGTSSTFSYGHVTRYAQPHSFTNGKESLMSRFELPAEDVLRAREKVVLDHFHNEVAQDWNATLSTFPHPHYELISMMRVHDGDSEVRKYYHDTRVAFPDQHHEIIALRHTVDAVVVEFWLLGTHLGPLGKMPPTGSKHRTRMTAYFIFDEHEKLIIERVYFDQLTILKQLLGGLDKRNPKDLLTLVRVIAGMLAMAGDEPDPRLLTTIPPDLSDEPPP